MTQYSGGNTTGFVSPAADSLEERIDLSEALDLNQPSRYLIRVQGHAMTPYGILDRDVLVLDSSLPPQQDKIAVVMVNGETLIGRLAWLGTWCLVSTDPQKDPISLDGDDALLWGIATSLVRDRL